MGDWDGAGQPRSSSENLKGSECPAAPGTDWRSAPGRLTSDTAAGESLALCASSRASNGGGPPHYNPSYSEGERGTESNVAGMLAS